MTPTPTSAGEGELSDERVFELVKENFGGRGHGLIWSDEPMYAASCEMAEDARWIASEVHPEQTLALARAIEAATRAALQRQAAEPVAWRFRLKNGPDQRWMFTEREVHPSMEAHCDIEPVFTHPSPDARPAPPAADESVGINGLTDAETSATASVMGFVAPAADAAPAASERDLHSHMMVVACRAAEQAHREYSAPHAGTEKMVLRAVCKAIVADKNLRGKLAPPLPAASEPASGAVQVLREALEGVMAIEEERIAAGIFKPNAEGMKRILAGRAALASISPSAPGSERVLRDALERTADMLMSACAYVPPGAGCDVYRKAEQEARAALDATAGATVMGAGSPIGWLYDFTHSSALGKPDERFTVFTTDEARARKHENVRPVWTHPYGDAQRDRALIRATWEFSGVSKWIDEHTIAAILAATPTPVPAAVMEDKKS